MSKTRTKQATSRRNSHYEKRLSSILKAASKVIAKDGFEGASVRRVAAKAGIGLSGIYYYFKSKDEMLFALQEHTFSTLVSSLKQRLDAANSAEDKLKAVVENHFQFFATNMDDLKVCVHEIGSLSGVYYKKILEIRREYYGLVKDVVAGIIKRPGHFDTNLATLFLFGSLNWVYMWYEQKKNSDINKLSDQLVKIFLNGIRAF